MGLVLELQNDLISKSLTIDVLRKAYLISRKLNVSDISQWLDNEMNGYKSEDLIPNYRKITGVLKYQNPFHGLQHVLIEDTDLEERLSKASVFWSVPYIQNSLREGKNTFYLQNLGTKACSKDLRMPVYLEIARPVFEDILEQTKNRILEWTMDLEKKGIMGDGMTFSEKEKEKAQTINYSIDNSIKNYGAYGDNINFDNSGNIGEHNKIDIATLKEIEFLIDEIQKLSDINIEIKEVLISNLQDLKKEKDPKKREGILKTLKALGTVIVNNLPYILDKINLISETLI